jgi:hypothetical protein
MHFYYDNYPHDFGLDCRFFLYSSWTMTLVYLPKIWTLSLVELIIMHSFRCWQIIPRRMPSHNYTIVHIQHRCQHDTLSDEM